MSHNNDSRTTQARQQCGFDNHDSHGCGSGGMLRIRFTLSSPLTILILHSVEGGCVEPNPNEPNLDTNELNADVSG